MLYGIKLFIVGYMINQAMYFFQIRKDEGTLYTTASGHLKAGETISEGFNREKTEIGIDIDATDAVLVDVLKFKLDRENKDGTIFKDRAFANVYVDLYEGDYNEKSK